MRPPFDDVVESITGTQRLRDLPLSQQFIIGRDLTGLDAQLYQFPYRVQLRFRRLDRIERTDEGNADAPVVEGEGMSADVIPAPAGVNETVATR